MNHNPKVWVVQKQHRWDAQKGELVPKFDLSPAEEYGELVYLLSPTASPFNPDPITQELRDKLSRFHPDDYLLLIGNPALIGWAVAIAADYTDGQVRLLQWNGKERRYIAIDSGDIYGGTENEEENHDDTDAE